MPVKIDLLYKNRKSPVSYVSGERPGDTLLIKVIKSTQVREVQSSLCRSEQMTGDTIIELGSLVSTGMTEFQNSRI